MDKKELKARVEKGEIHCRVVFQVVGTPKEHVEKLMDDYLVTIDSEKEYEIIDKDASHAEKQGDVYSVISEVELLAKDLQALNTLCFNYMPATIEINDPKELTYKRRDVDALFNDLLAKLHEVNMLAQEAALQNKSVLGNMKKMIENAILLSVRHGNTVTETAEHLGMRKQDLDPFVAGLIKQERLVQKGNSLERASPTKKTSKKAKKTETKVSESSPKAKKK